ncbi:hypothetical protein [Pedobacter frigidisoli]|uniref:hypothetical protein n=1 Tax=Pedobacter frigidisoli TaxID=2530455 RepID=UPI0029309497|nr:hypothetical protein [Pedobacter frigidisoli]
MHYHKTISHCFLFLFLVFLDSGLSAKHPFQTIDLFSTELKGTKQERVIDLRRLRNRSFVVSCGGGCAMTYTARDIRQNASLFWVKFRVDMYIDGDLSDTYAEQYSFIYDSSHSIVRVLDIKDKNVLETMTPGARKSFREFGIDLIKVYGVRSNFQRK